MEIRKTYRSVNPELLFDEVKGFIEKQGAVLGETTVQAYSNPDGSSHTIRGTALFKMRDAQGGVDREAVRLHIVGSSIGETKLMLDIDDKVVPEVSITALQSDLGFMLDSYEVKPKR